MTISWGLLERLSNWPYGIDSSTTLQYEVAWGSSETSQ